jgi:hypothetical protein
VAEERQGGGQQGVGDQHRGQHAERAADAELGHEVEADEGQAGDGDRDGQAGEEHGATRGRAGLGGGVAGRQPLVQELSEPRDDEQRVVDPHPQPDHRDEDRRDRVDVGQAGENEEQQERGHQRGDRERDRDQHRRERAEDDQQDDHRREQAERLGDALLDRRELRLAVVLDRHARRPDALPDGVLHRDHLVAVLVLDGVVELRLGVGDAAVVGERLLAERVADALEAGLAVPGLELGRLQARNRGRDSRAALGRVEPLAAGRGEDDVEDRALLGREL